MHKRMRTNFLVACVLSVSLLMSFLTSAVAQAPAPTPIPTATPSSVAQQLDPNVVTFSMLGQNEIQLIGSLDATSFLFALPADWKLTSGARIDLAMAVSLNSALQTAASTPAVSPLTAASGTLSVTFNNVLLGVVPLNQPGEINTSLLIPESAFPSIRQDGRMTIGFTFNSGYSCYIYQQMSVAIHTSTQLLLPHDLVALPTDLNNFPQPIYQGSFLPDSAVVVIPDQPSSADLQDAMIVAAGLGNLSGGTLLWQMTTVSQLTSDQKTNDHLIYVGKADSLPILKQLQIPLPIADNQFQTISGDDGLVQMVNSPWSQNHVVLVVSGNTGGGVMKAAQAVSTGKLLPDRYPNVSVIQNILSASVSAPQRVDQTLSDMGYSRRLYTNLGVYSTQYQFYIPPGSTVSSDARFDLVFGNSSLLNYDRSGIVVLVNNIPIGSVRLNDSTASQPTNKVGISIPASAVLPGFNSLLIKVNLIPLDNCTPPNLQGLWIQVWPESNFHLPLIQTPVNPVSTLDLASYPAPFIYNPSLGSTAFVLAHNDLDSWRSALQIAAYLGRRTNGTLSALSVYYSDQMPDADRAKFNLIVIGLPSQSPLVGELNGSLPVPFANGDNLSAVNSSQVTYRISADSPLGYIEMMPSPWNSNNIILAVLGNTSTGLGWAANALIDPTLRSNLAGNFDVINNRQILTNDTRVASIVAATSVPAMQSGVAALPPNVTTPAVPSTRPGWVLPLLAAAVLFIIVILVVAVIQSRIRNRVRGPHKAG